MREIWGREYRVEDALAIKKILNEEWMREHPMYVDWAVAARSAYVSGTFGYEDTIIGCAGITLKYDGCAEAWAMISEDARFFKKEVAVLAPRIIDTWQTATGFYRVQCAVEADNPVVLRFAEFCGFKQEGRMRKSGPYGRDQIMMARVR